MTQPIRLRMWQTKGRWYWNAKAGNNEIVAASEQGYRSKWWCKFKARRAYPGVPLVDVEGP